MVGVLTADDHVVLPEIEAEPALRDIHADVEWPEGSEEPAAWASIRPADRAQAGSSAAHRRCR